MQLVNSRANLCISFQEQMQFITGSYGRTLTQFNLFIYSFIKAAFKKSKRAKPNNNFIYIVCFIIKKMVRVILIKFLLIVLTATTPCTDIGIPNCTRVDINNTRNSPNSCKCLTCDVGLIRSGSELSCCLNGTNYCLQCDNFTCVKC